MRWTSLCSAMRTSSRNSCQGPVRSPNGFGAEVPAPDPPMGSHVAAEPPPPVAPAPPVPPPGIPLSSEQPPAPTRSRISGRANRCAQFRRMAGHSRTTMRSCTRRGPKSGRRPGRRPGRESGRESGCEVVRLVAQGADQGLASPAVPCPGPSSTSCTSCPSRTGRDRSAPPSPVSGGGGSPRPRAARQPA